MGRSYTGHAGDALLVAPVGRSYTGHAGDALLVAPVGRSYTGRAGDGRVAPVGRSYRVAGHACDRGLDVGMAGCWA